MKDNFTHVCFIIDESGSMDNAIDDVKGGFKKIIKEQKANTVGTCAVSVFTFDGSVRNPYTLRDISEVSTELEYNPAGSTALNDAVGIAIDKIGEKLAEMPEEERPSSNLIVIMTDGGENSSRHYSLTDVRSRIKHQTDKYNWTFMYLGADITTSSIADSLGVRYRGFSTKKNLDSNYSMVNSVLYCARNSTAENATAVMDSAVSAYVTTLNDSFEGETGIKLSGTIQ